MIFLIAFKCQIDVCSFFVFLTLDVCSYNFKLMYVLIISLDFYLENLIKKIYVNEV